MSISLICRRGLSSSYCFNIITDCSNECLMDLVHQIDSTLSNLSDGAPLVMIIALEWIVVYLLRGINFLAEGCGDCFRRLAEAQGSLELLEIKNWNVEEIREIVEEFPNVQQIFEGLGVYDDLLHLWGLLEHVGSMELRHKLDEFVINGILDLLSLYQLWIQIRKDLHLRVENHLLSEGFFFCQSIGNLTIDDLADRWLR